MKVLGLGIFNLILAIFLSPLLEGIARKVVALIQSRIGPPLLQPYFDLLKLFGKEEVTNTDNILFKYTPLICFSSTLLLALLIPFGIDAPLSMSGDIIVFSYILIFSALMVLISGISSGSPYGVIGSSREMMMILTVEPVFVIALITAAVKSESLSFSGIAQWQIDNGLPFSMMVAGTALFLTILRSLSRMPFDIVEAETEIMGGPFIEQAGPKLALFKWSYYVKNLVFASLFFSVFFPWPHFDFALLNIIMVLVKIGVFVSIVAVVHSVNPRLRVDQTIKYFGVIIFIAFAGLAFALVGV